MSHALISWSTGKDSAWALLAAQRAGMEVVGVVTSVTDPYGRVSMHGVRESVLSAQVEQLGLPLHVVRLPAPCSNEAYQERQAGVLSRCRDDGVTHVVFGDLFLEDVRAYREAQMDQLGMTPVFPLWQRSTIDLAAEMLDQGLEAIVTTVDPRQLDPSFAGRRFDHDFLIDLPDTVDPCGERGEFHTVVTSGPMFRVPLILQTGKTVERDGFLFTDVTMGVARR